MKNLKEYAKELLINEIESAKDWVDLSEYQDNWSDLAFKLLESYNVDGSITYNTYESEEILKDYYYEVGDYIEEIKEIWDTEINPFKEPERALVVIVLYIASGLNIEINDDTTWEDIKEQL